MPAQAGRSSLRARSWRDRRDRQGGTASGPAAAARGRSVAALPSIDIARGIRRPCRPADRACGRTHRRCAHASTRRRPERRSCGNADGNRLGDARCRCAAAARHKGRRQAEQFVVQAVEAGGEDVDAAHCVGDMGELRLRPLHPLHPRCSCRARPRCVSQVCDGVGERRGDAGMQRAAAGDLPRRAARRLFVVDGL